MQLQETPAKIDEDIKQLFEDNLIENPIMKGVVICATSLENAVHDVDILIECIIEDFDIKCNLFKNISDLAPVNCIITTNTLTLSVNSFAEKVKNTGRFLGLRFLYPVYFIAEVEITPSKYTSNLVIEKIRKLMSQMEKILFFRSGSVPLTLSEEKINYKRLQRIEAIQSRKELPNTAVCGEELLPELTKENLNSHLNKLNIDKREKETQSINCTICVEKLRNSILMPCNHLIACFDCSTILKTRQDPCPVCRQDINEVMRIYIP